MRAGGVCVERTRRLRVAPVRNYEFCVISEVGFTDSRDRADRPRFVSLALHKLTCKGVGVA
jgi:hypothetical protein